MNEYCTEVHSASNDINRNSVRKKVRLPDNFKMFEKSCRAITRNKLRLGYLINDKYSLNQVLDEMKMMFLHGKLSPTVWEQRPLKTDSQISNT